jgi:hypothetical protein
MHIYPHSELSGKRASKLHSSKHLIEFFENKTTKRENRAREITVSLLGLAKQQLFAEVTNRAAYALGSQPQP